MKATEQYFPVVLFMMLYKVVLTFKSVGEILIGLPSAVRFFDRLFLLWKFALLIVAI